MSAPATPSSAWAMSPIRMPGATTAWCSTWPNARVSVVTHIAMNEVPDATVNLYGHVHNNEPLREGPYVNICVEHTEDRPLPLDAVRRLALARLDDPRPGGDDGRGNPLPGYVV